MKSIRVIALNTFREIIRDRILYSIVVFAFLLFGLSVVLGELSFTEQARISADFGFTGIQISVVVLSIFAGSTLVAREIEKQTVLTLLAKPVSRSQFLLGKFAGLTLVVTSVLVGLSVVLALLLLGLGLSVTQSFFAAIFGIWLEAIILVALALFFGSFARPIMTVVFAASFFLLGHMIGSLDFFIKKSNSTSFRAVARVISDGLPNLEKFNWRFAPVYEVSIGGAELLSASVYAMGWIMILLAATVLIFRRRDFV